MEEKKIREKDHEQRVLEKRLLNLYFPVSALEENLIYQYSAHSFSNLTDEEKSEFIHLMNKNVVYADKYIYDQFTELKWAIKSCDGKKADALYEQITSEIDDEMEQMRRKLKFPRLYRK